jgi:Heterokaryon incompatibility protein (HET)
MASSSKQFSTSHIIDPSRQTPANEYSLFDFSNEEPGIGACKTHIDSEPSPAFEGWIATPEKALKGRRFTHTPLENADEQFRLLLLLPHNGYPSSVLQCALVHTPKKDPPEFLYISNSTYGNPFVLATILVNGLLFQIPRALDFLLRRLRDVEHGKLLFAFPICETPVPRGTDSDVAKALRLCESELFLRPNATEIIDMIAEIEGVDAEELSAQCLATDYEILYIPLPDGRLLSPVYVPFLVEFWEGHKDSIYMPLDLLAKEIRVLIIEPHKGDSLSEVQCRLRHAPLKGITSFNALSYTWGSTDNLVPISLDGSRMDITPNLHSALLQLRKEDDPVVFWIDALCINQRDIKERNRQVRRMAEIYQAAAEVVIWLGDSDHDSDVAIGLMRKQFEHAQSHLSSLGLGNAASVMQKLIHHQYTDSQNQDELVASAQQELASVMASSEMLEMISKIKDEDPFLSDPMDLLAVYRFLNRPWFCRTWIVQEIVNARYVLVRCGDRTVEWVMMVLFAEKVASSSYLVKLMLDQIKSEEVKQYAPWEVQFERVGILTKMRHAKGKNFDFKLLLLMTLNRFNLATNPRDKIYGFLGMAADGKELVPRPDYSISTHELFIDLTKAMVKYGSLDVICSSQPPLKGPWWSSTLGPRLDSELGGK